MCGTKSLKDWAKPELYEYLIYLMTVITVIMGYNGYSGLV